LTLREAIARSIEGRDLTAAEAEAVMGAIMAGEATAAQIAGWLVALRMKGETVDEIAGFARAMRERANRVPTDARPLVDVCGTGGDARGTFNISTTVAFVVAGAGISVAKHGNRSVSSRCGSADVLEALGVGLDLSPDDVGRCVDEVGIGFLYAPRLHPAMKHAIGPRREMGIRTVFNLLGPLTNPAEANVQLLGVFDPSLTEPLAEVLGALGVEAGVVVHGGGGLDELSTIGPSRVSRWADGTVETTTVDATALGLATARLADLAGGDAVENARTLRDVLEGQPGPRRDIVLLNAAAALVAAERAGDLHEGITVASEAIDSGAAHERLDALVSLSQRLGGAP
jgi:anthranilate phosphoribosyltransferase